MMRHLAKGTHTRPHTRPHWHGHTHTHTHGHKHTLTHTHTHKSITFTSNSFSLLPPLQVPVYYQFRSCSWCKHICVCVCVCQCMHGLNMIPSDKILQKINNEVISSFFHSSPYWNELVAQQPCLWLSQFSECNMTRLGWHWHCVS